MIESSCDVVIVGAGLAGLSLARHLQLTSDKRVLVIEKREELPPVRQKVGESLVQVGGYYFAKALDLEEHLLHEHFMKYNLRFYWKTAGRTNTRFEDYSQAYIRTFSNIPCYQLDRNVFEGELLDRIAGDPRFEVAAPASDVNVTLSDTDERHTVSYTHDGRRHDVYATWVVDTTGRGRLLARQMKLCEPSPIRHGAAFMWVDGLVDIEKLTDRSLTQIRHNPARRSTGHLPHWLATNHFMGEGFWFWVIPLRGRTSLGVVYDHRIFSGEIVSSAEKLRDWICREFPLFARDLPTRRIVDFRAIKEFSYGCRETINPSRWAMSGESGRFTDPLYSPGSDFIALHNTLIVDAILTDDDRKLQRKCRLFEILMQAMHRSLLPTYATSYNALGDQEVYVLKYTWELSVYFSFFLFPFINDLATDLQFVPAFLSRFARLGALNERLQQFLSDYFQWKKVNGIASSGRIFHDFTDLEPLRRSEEMFYQVGVTADEAKELLDDQVVNLKELARFIVAYVYSVVLNDNGVPANAAFVESLDAGKLSFDPDRMRADYALHEHCERVFEWTFDATALRPFCCREPGHPRGTNIHHDTGRRVGAGVLHGESVFIDSAEFDE